MSGVPPGSVRVCPQCGAQFGLNERFCPTDGSTLRLQAPSEGLVGQVLAGRYEIRRLLGEGGMGQVYLAEQIKMRRPCALKVMRAAQMDDADAAGRFGREAFNASRIMHPHVATIYDFGETDDGRLFIAMEYVDGRPLSDLLRRGDRLPIDRAVDIAQQIGEALGAAHDLGIVHRDLKPDNVMLATSKSGRDVVKVVDFGIAKAAQIGGQTITRTGLIVGTPAYMSPEQIAGDPLDGRSDLYALGCILFKMLTGTEPQAGSAQELLVHRLVDDAPRAKAINPAVPSPLDDVVARALERSARDRFDTAETFCAALSDAMTASRQAWPARRLWSALQEKAASLRRSPAPDIVAPSQPVGASPVTPPSPALARPRVPRPASRSQPTVPLHEQAPAGLAPTAGAAPAVASAGDPATPAAPWRASVERTPAAAPATLVAPAAVQRGRWSLRRFAISGVIGGAAIVAIVVIATERAGSARNEPQTASPSSVSSQASQQPPSALPSQPSPQPQPAQKAPSTEQPPPEQPPTEQPHRTAPISSPDKGGPPGREAASESRVASPPSKDATLGFEAAERAAMDRRDVAVSAGATSQDLTRGDALRTRADQAAQSGQFAIGSSLADEAARAWDDAAHAASERAKLAVAPAGTPNPSGGQGTNASPAPPAGTSNPTNSAPTSGALNPTGPVTTATTPADSAAGSTGAGDVRNVLADYVSAINARQIDAMRRIWPSMPDDAARNWQALFNAATDLKVTLVSVDPTTPKGTRAQTNFAYTINGFVPSQGSLPGTTVRFRVKLERDAFGWRIVSMDRK